MIAHTKNTAAGQGGVINLCSSYKYFMTIAEADALELLAHIVAHTLGEGCEELLDSIVGRGAAQGMGVLECLSPLYWVQLIIFLPVKLCELSGISGDKLAVKIIQIIYWGLTPLFLCFRTEMYDFVIHLLQKM